MKRKRKYDTDLYGPDEANICLNCPFKKCTAGGWEHLKNERKRIKAEKHTHEGDERHDKGAAQELPKD